MMPENEQNHYRYVNIDFNYQYDTRDVYKDPLKGSLFEISTGYQKSLTDISSDIAQLSISFNKKELNRVIALPVIKNVYENKSNSFIRIVVPFTDGKKVINIVIRRLKFLFIFRLI